MKILQKVMAFYNEKGNISAQTRGSMKTKVAEKLKNQLEKHFTNGVIVGADGSFYMPLAVAHNDNVIYAKVDLTITDKVPPTEKKTKKSSDIELDD